MKKLVVFIALIIFVSFSEFGFCQEIKNRWAVGVAGSYVQPEDAEYEDAPAYLGKATLGYGINDHLALEAEADTFQLKSKTGSRVRVNSLLINLEIRTKTGKFFPYAILGAGWSFFSFKNLTPEEKKDKSNSYAYKTGVGVEYLLDKNWALNYEAVHFYTTTGKTNLEVYNWQHSLGIKYYF